MGPAPTNFTGATEKAKVGSYGFLTQMRFHELNCLFNNNDDWFQANREDVFNITREAYADATVPRREATYRVMLDQQPEAFKNVYSNEQCMSLFPDTGSLDVAT